MRKIWSQFRSVEIRWKIMIMNSIIRTVAPWFQSLARVAHAQANRCPLPAPVRVGAAENHGAEGVSPSARMPIRTIGITPTVLRHFRAGLRGASTGDSEGAGRVVSATRRPMAMAEPISNEIQGWPHSWYFHHERMARAVAITKPKLRSDDPDGSESEWRCS